MKQLRFSSLLVHLIIWMLVSIGCNDHAHEKFIEYEVLNLARNIHNPPPCFEGSEDFLRDCAKSGISGELESYTFSWYKFIIDNQSICRLSWEDERMIFTLDARLTNNSRGEIYLKYYNHTYQCR